MKTLLALILLSSLALADRPELCTSSVLKDGKQAELCLAYNKNIKNIQWRLKEASLRALSERNAQQLKGWDSLQTLRGDISMYTGVPIISTSDFALVKISLR